MDLELRNIVNEYLSDFKRKKSLSSVVENSIPIVWFGDMEAYKNSELKVVTVGLNPSLHEFPTNGMPRFDLSADNANALYETLNDYYKHNPYNKWFVQFEKCLNRIDASYGGKMSCDGFSNTAIHIDVYSSIATDPTWGRLPEYSKSQVMQRNLFEEFLEYLKPDVILMSVAHDCFEDAMHISNPRIIYYKRRKVEIYRENDRIMVYGLNKRGTPFGGITNEVLDEAFAKLRSVL